jgi:hypothetical protein
VTDSHDEQMERAMAEVQLEKDGYAHAERTAILKGEWVEPTNADRAARAEQTARYYCTLVNQSYTDDGPDTAVTDLLVDIKHWCDRNDQIFDDLVRQADNHYTCEVAEEENP